MCYAGKFYLNIVLSNVHMVKWVFVCLVIFITCSNDEEEATEQSLAEAPSAATWLVIQDRILSQKCV